MCPTRIGHVHLLNRRFDDALVVGREAVVLNSNCTGANGFFVNVLHCCGDQDGAIKTLPGHFVVPRMDTPAAMPVL